MAERLVSGLMAAALVGAPTGVSAQSFETLGTRAAGMAGASVAAVDDASAVYWNPAALASGSFFSLVFDQSRGERKVPSDLLGNSSSATFFALGTPPLGVSYYRLETTTVEPSPVQPVPASPAVPGVSGALASRLVTHHVGVTLVQSLIDGIAVGTTLKFVHGEAAVGPVAGGSLDDLLDAAGDLPDSGTNTFDADLGVMASVGGFRAGVTIRNVVEPEFDTPTADTPIELDRLSRVGVAYDAGAVLVAADLDLERARSELGEARHLALGTEVRLVPKLFVRSGFRVNTLGNQPGGRAPVVSIGGSYAARGSLLVDAQFTTGSEAGARGWGIAGRFVF